jgi:Na+-translocating ferredoxin:NAD+ oxidoreductase RNF subunit RnfB
VAALGIVKDKQKVDQSAPGLKEVVTAILEILPVQGSKALHDEIKVMLQVRSAFSVLSCPALSSSHVCTYPRLSL